MGVDRSVASIQGFFSKSRCGRSCPCSPSTRLPMGKRPPSYSEDWESRRLGGHVLPAARDLHLGQVDCGVVATHRHPEGADQSRSDRRVAELEHRPPSRIVTSLVFGLLLPEPRGRRPPRPGRPGPPPCRSRTPRRWPRASRGRANHGQPASAARPDRGCGGRCSAARARPRRGRGGRSRSSTRRSSASSTGRGPRSPTALRAGGVRSPGSRASSAATHRARAGRTFAGLRPRSSRRVR